MKKNSAEYDIPIIISNTIFETQEKIETVLVSHGIPFPEGLLKSTNQVILFDSKNKPISLQTKILDTWSDGSIKWLLLSFFTKLRPNKRTHRYLLSVQKNQVKNKVTEHRSTFTVSSSNKHLCISSKLHSFELMAKGIMNDGKVVTASFSDLKVLEDGPLFSVIKASGRLQMEKSLNKKVCILDLQIKICKQNHCQYLDVETYLFNDSENHLDFQNLWLEIPWESENIGYDILGARPVGAYLKEFSTEKSTSLTQPLRFPENPAENLIFDNSYQEILNSPQALSGFKNIILGTNAEDIFEKPYYYMRINNSLATKFKIHGHSRMYYNAPPNLVRISRFNGKADLAVVLKDSIVQHPNAIELTQNTINTYLYHGEDSVLSFPIGMAKRHNLRFILKSHRQTPEELHAHARTFQTCCLATIPVDKLNKTEALPLMLEYFPEEYPFFEEVTRHGIIHICLYHRTYGILTHGESVSQNNQLLRNEYDLLRGLVIQYLRTGENIYSEYMHALGKLLTDVNTVHFGRPEIKGSQYSHNSDKEKLFEMYGPPCHQWVEGLLLYYSISGDEKALIAAKETGSRILALLENKPDTLYYVRGAGWPLLILSQLYKYTYQKEYLTGAGKLSRFILSWVENDGGFRKKRCVPYLPREAQSVDPFTQDMYNRTDVTKMYTLIGGIALKEYYDISNDQEAKQAFLKIADFVNSNYFSPHKIPHYMDRIEEPFHCGLDLQLLGYAYEITKDDKYLYQGLNALYFETSFKAFIWQQEQNNQLITGKRVAHWLRLFGFLHYARQANLLDKVPLFDCVKD